MMFSFQSRRTWLGRAGRSAVALAVAPRASFVAVMPLRATNSPWPDVPSTMGMPAGPMQALAQQAVDVAKSAGAQYADARLTRVVQHSYSCIGEDFLEDIELVAVGVRALVNGYWGFAASPFQTADDVTELARDAVAQAMADAKGPAQPIELSATPVVTGSWATPIAIDPFQVTIEEKRDYIEYWTKVADYYHVTLDRWRSRLYFARQERVLATSDGSLVTQRCYETEGGIFLRAPKTGDSWTVPGLQRAGKGWELFLDANVPDQIAWLAAHPPQATMQRAALVGRYTIVCDGDTMASLVDRTLGVATQLDRALGYEANATGTSYLDDPLDMVGTLSIASPLVTLTANRSAPAQLATVQWDDEGVVPQDFTLVKDGVLTDFQTTREQASWLAPYYQRRGRPVRSNGCAASETALTMTMQHMPNLALAPGAADVSLADLIATVSDGVLIEDGSVESDWQARGGLISGTMRQIRNGRLGSGLSNGAISFDTMDIWKNLKAMGGPSTIGRVDHTQYDVFGREEKGEPEQAASHSVRAPAAVMANQPMIDPSRKS